MLLEEHLSDADLKQSFYRRCATKDLVIMMVNSLFVGLSSLVALTVWLVYSRVDLRLRPSQRFTRTGCLPIRNANQYDPVFGLDLFLRLGRAASARRYLDFWDRHMFGRYGNTFDVRLMGQRLVFTNEPANIQSMLATQFHDFDVGQRRRDNSADLLGVGVFNADGADWAHARATVRPNFSRKQFSDLGLFEKHFQVWKDALPGTRDAVDLQEWAFRYVSACGHMYKPCACFKLVIMADMCISKRLLMLGRSFSLATQQVFCIPRHRLSGNDLPGPSAWVSIPSRNGSGWASLQGYITTRITKRPARWCTAILTRS